MLTVAPASVAVRLGYSTGVFAINEFVPTIRVNCGEEFAARVVNQLAEPLVLHWHGILAPEDAGWRDTVPVDAGETVRILGQFASHSGVFLQHCHNLEHEDDGMMQNFEAFPRPTLPGRRDDTSVNRSSPESARGKSLESSTEADGAAWEPVAEPATAIGGRWTVTVTEVTERRFYLLVKP